MKKFLNYFTKGELMLWSISVFAIIISFIIFDKSDYLTLIASLIGITSLIFNAKGNPVGQALMIVFSICYGVISYNFAYYGEMVTYLGMTAPMALLALISWLKNPYKGNKAQVKINILTKKEVLSAVAASVVIAIGFYFILQAFNTANIIPSTISVATSFFAVYLTFRRSPLFAAAYAANDIVLITLWILAAAQDSSYISVIICFIAFFINDLYGYINWRKMQKKQELEENQNPVV